MKTLHFLAWHALLAVSTMAAQPDTDEDAFASETDAAPPFEIVGGAVVPPDQRSPWIVGLRETRDGVTICGGSLITPYHVLTAAHCYDPNIKYVAINTYYAWGASDGEYIRIRSHHIHPNYRQRTISFDFMILELEQPSSVPPVRLSTRSIGTDDVVTIQGWGDKSENGQPSKRLKSIELKVQSNSKCRKALDETINDSMFCAGGEFRQDSCKGDSGGPASMIGHDEESVLVGVVSWGDGCGRKGKPGVYGRVSKAANFIQTVIPGFQFVS